jgi:hypothetical protein
MSHALERASSLKPNIRLSQAISKFEAVLTSEQKFAFQTLKTQSLSKAPSHQDVMQFTAELNRCTSNQPQCFGPRFTSFLEGVQLFAALGDVLVGGSQNLLSCGVWSLVRMSLMVSVSYPIVLITH